LKLSRKAEGTGPMKPWQPSVMKGAKSCPNLLGKDNIGNSKPPLESFLGRFFFAKKIV